MVANKEEVISLLKIHQNKIRNFGVKRLGLFGSFARGENKSTSDLDFLVELDRKTYDAYMDLKTYLETLFECPVDLVTVDSLKPRLRSAVLKETIYA